ncbi:hypothetical protein E5F05_12635 [Deinococcus metallilatus]|uniref:Uncharacterized protein n=1 Tax=Deinococcus metallilatus TaxID=1211322 RepID=A0AAJ5F4B8_9DEIO|nr:hypothetical protein [Deinococcus metallilatus]MBB5295116.1 hypothetical protein [Deinococcus metallilatus]QBY08705.1 hypothetical protein E5F05_12635 [Deinococcus metallilatus]RXJ10584.1 hypothetical protein ERJ73_11465 [Deinococcus metallilatus]TLK26555.1 hypothetical protein FCS05_11215 [Deinococcus metallilatus]GMA14889.1 hypothetical protein GCM10025871_12200 [Deinococcus metallilatus]
MPDFTPGQRWAYHTRPGEEDSTLLILRREALGDLPVLHIQLQGLRLRNPFTASGLQTDLGHMPISEEAVQQSVTDLLEQNATPSDDGGGYEEWRAAYERGEAGVFTLPVAQVVQALEDAVNAPTPADTFSKSNRK